MRYRVISRCIVRGNVAHVGDVLDITKEEFSKKKKSMIPLDDENGDEIPDENEEVVAGLNREQLIQRLRENGVKIINPKITNETLKEKFRETFSEE